MTKKELASELARKRGMRDRDALAVVDGFARAVSRALSDGQAVTLRGFGRFEVRRRAGRSVRAPGSDRKVDIPARLSPCFHAAPELGRRLMGRPAASRATGGREQRRPGR